MTPATQTGAHLLLGDLGVAVRTCTAYHLVKILPQYSLVPFSSPICSLWHHSYALETWNGVWACPMRICTRMGLRQSFMESGYTQTLNHQKQRTVQLAVDLRVSKFWVVQYEVRLGIKCTWWYCIQAEVIMWLDTLQSQDWLKMLQLGSHYFSIQFRNLNQENLGSRF